MRSVTVFLVLFLVSLSASVIAQEEMSAYEQERLKMQQLQTEMLETRLALLEKRLLLITEGEQPVSATEMEYLKYRVLMMQDSIRLLNKVMLEMWHDFYRPLEPEMVVLQREKREIREKPPVDYLMGLQAVRLFQGSFDFGFERILSRSWSGEVAVSVTWVSRYGFGSNYLLEQDFSYFDPQLSSNVYYTGQMLRGFGVSLTPRNYLFKIHDTVNKAPFGLYAAPIFEYRYFRITGERESDMIPYNKKEFNRHLGLINAGILLGYQFHMFQVISLDLYVGGVFRVSKYAGEKHLTKYKDWTNFDYTGIIPTAGVRIKVLK